MEKEVLQSSNIPATETQSVPQEASQSSVQIPETPKRKLWLIIGMSLLALLLLGATGFFAYQNYQLKKEAPQVQPAMTPTSFISPQPTSIERAPTSSVSNVENSTIVFEKDGRIFLLKGLSAQPIEVTKGNGPALSPNRSKIAYVRMDEDNDMHIYEISTGKIETLHTDEWRLRDVSWSPNGKYLITDSGTSPKGSGAIYEYPTGKKITTFSTYGEKVMWLSNEKFVFVEPQSVTPPREYGFGEGNGLSKISILNGEKEILAQATVLEDFNLLKVENEIIYYSKTTVKDSGDWVIPNKEEVSFWQMNNNGEEKRTIIKPEILKEKVAQLLPLEFSDYRLVFGPIIHPNANNWIIFDINKEGSAYNDPICIMDINSPTDSFRQIATGSYPSW